jgi:glycosyltransferase involved in cell wall biosynthesis
VHVLLLLRSLQYGGTQRQTVELARGLRQRGNRVSVVTFYDGGALSSLLPRSDFDLVSLGKGGRWDILRFLRRLAHHLRRLRPDVIHSFLPTPNLAALVARLVLPGTPIVWGLRGTVQTHTADEWLARLELFAEPKLANLASLVIANSQSGAASAVAAGFPAQKLRVVPNGIDTDRFRPDAPARDRLRREWGIADGSPLVGFVGRLDPVKDVATFLRAAQLLRDRLPAIRFAIVGDKPEPYGSEARALAAQLALRDAIIWEEARPDVETVYNALDLLASTSVSEGFSNAIAEALACGVPVVATAVGDAAALIAGHGRVVPPRDPAQLAAAVARQLATPVSPAECHRRIAEEFSIAALALRTEQLLATLIPTALPRDADADARIAR